ncbi:MAG TPA: hypothetical protein VKW04_11360 [Planctomycetota bacterium]|nr:hypothetical protein [Planctomycetota bacterium]
MTSDTREPALRASFAAPPGPESRSNPDFDETVAIVECRERPSAQGYRDVTALVNRQASGHKPLLLILRNLERIDGSLTGFILGLESILRTSARPVLLADPSGLAPLVLASSLLDRRVRPLPAPSRHGTVLIVHPSPSAGSILCAVLEAFGRSCTLVHSGLDARAAIVGGRFDEVLVDLDLPGLQSYAVAEFLKSQRWPAMPIGVTRNDEAWNLETCVHYGFRRLLPKPYSLADMLGLMSEATARRGG